MPGSFALPTSRAQGFATFVLRNEFVEVAVVPELGAKVVSLKNLRTGREWMWAPDSSRRLFRNASCDAFENSTLVGWDECLPTIAPCRWNGRELPDHGEVWSAKARVETASNESVTTLVALPVSPLTFTRTLRLAGNFVLADYKLTSRSAATERFIWAMHPLLAIEEGDQLELPHAAGTSLGDASWVRSLAFDSEPACAKRFIREVGRGVLSPPQRTVDSASSRRGEDTAPYRELRAGVFNPRTGDCISFEWSAAENDTLGLWLTRGGWHGHHHLAIEPTNATHDSLAVAAGDLNHAGSIAAGQTLSWSVRIQLTP